MPTIGAPGKPASGETVLDAAEGGLVPKIFVAVTVNAYAWPFTNPETVIGALVPVAVKLLGLDVTV